MHTKERSKHQMRERIANLAAKLMAEDGIDDFAQAKRKAAEQLGSSDTHCLPNNHEIEAALRVFHSLYQPGHEQVLDRLRREALGLMRLFENFNPYLTGSVLSGTAGRYSDINLQLYTDSVKDFEFFLLERKIPYRTGEIRSSRNRPVPVFHLERDGVAANVAVFSREDLRGSQAGEARARAAAVEALLAPTQANP